ncbi:hypothetical protein CORC01_12648 [Colletotrichum orchidophilum]|uniref:Uncharacterized protein n=1 Tax=Colletotrichum orchidophilum TaxID=1209926 RepID=A0A1G4ASC6_9PEZI|nr:uncharacterized protein CORC01_12648 [Colletotrichum orchidophilum]OHE92067.1 hypothetical protein CORC01_12648 [Colletotrichum orchidophilum]
MSMVACHWTSAGPSDTRRADADASRLHSATCKEKRAWCSDKKTHAIRPWPHRPPTLARCNVMNGCFSLQKPIILPCLSFHGGLLSAPSRDHYGYQSDHKTWIANFAGLPLRCDGKGTPSASRAHSYSWMDGIEIPKENPSISISSVSKADYHSIHTNRRLNDEPQLA